MSTRFRFLEIPLQQVILLLLALFSMSHAVLAENRAQTRPIVFGQFEFYPLTYRNAQGRYVGVHDKLIMAVFDDAGYDYRFQTLPPKRLLDSLVAGEVDMVIGIAYAPQIKDGIYGGESVLRHVEMNMYYLGNTAPIQTKEQLRGKSLISILGYRYIGLGEYIRDPQNRIVNHTTKDHYTALRMLRNRRADYLLGYKSPIDKAQLEQTVPDLKKTTFSSHPVRFIISRKTPNAKRILHDLDASYQKLLAAKAFDSLVDG